MSKCYCCINFWHFKLKVVILICLEVAQSEVVISNTTTHPLDASAAHKFAALTPRSVKLRLHGQVGSGLGSAVVSGANQVRSSSQENMENMESIPPAPGLLPCLQFYVSRLQEVGFIFSPQNYLQHLAFRSQSTERIQHRERAEGAEEAARTPMKF